MVKNKKQLFIIVGTFIIALMLFTTTYAFFNYTKAGSSNTIRTGRISFNHTQGESINLTNMFPIDVSEGIPNDNTKVGTVTINITGDTTYTEGIEYKVSAVDVSNSVPNSSKVLPISIDVSVASNSNNDPTTTLGTEDEDYFEDRGGVTSYYKVLSKDVVANDGQLLVGYIAPGSDGVDGNIIIRAYLDAGKIAISDTYEQITYEYEYNNHMTSTEFASCLTFINDEWYYSGYLDNGTTTESFCQGTGTSYNSTFQEWIDSGWFYDYEIESLVNYGVIIKNPNYTNDTSSLWVSGREVFTTTEWNSLQTNGVSFKVKVEANEGIWVNPTSETCFTVSGSTITGYDVSCGTDVYIPRTINGNIMTTIGAMSFFNMNLTSVHISDAITVIDSMAFQNNKITTLELGDNVRTIGVKAFNNNLITSLEIPNSVETISLYAFSHNNITGNLTIPSSVTEIGECAFENSGNYTNVVIPNTVTTFGDYLFKNSTINQLSVDITTISNTAFKEAGINNLTLGNNVVTITQGAFENNKINTLVIPSSVSTIGSAFQYNHIASVTIPSTVEYLSCYAFINQTNDELENITTNIIYEQNGFTCTN